MTPSHFSTGVYKEVQGPVKYQLLTSWLTNGPSLNAATDAFFFSSASGIDAMNDTLRLIQNEMPKEVLELFKTIFSQEPGQKQLAEILSTVPKGEPGLDELWKLLADWIPAKQLKLIKSSVGTVDLEELTKNRRISLTPKKLAEQLGEVTDRP